MFYDLHGELAAEHRKDLLAAADAYRLAAEASPPGALRRRGVALPRSLHSRRSRALWDWARHPVTATNRKEVDRGTHPGLGDLGHAGSPDGCVGS